MLKQYFNIMQITVLTKKIVHRICFIEQKTYHVLRKTLCVRERKPIRKRLWPNQYL